ncbi:hypothetical protein TNCV_3264871 [Trichonephila clavipes]|nr:hypothetical protein TNCV_3264871 [Trichonephila clavipes]
MVKEACLRAEERFSVELAERLSLPERIPTPPAQRPAEPESTPPAEPRKMPPTQPEKLPPAEPEKPPLEMVDPSVSVNTVEVTPPLITRSDKSTQTIFPYLHVKHLEFGKRCMEQPQDNKKLSIKQETSENSVQQTVSKNIVLLVPRNRPLMKLGNNAYIIQHTNVNKIGVNN